MAWMGSAGAGGGVASSLVAVVPPPIGLPHVARYSCLLLLVLVLRKHLLVRVGTSTAFDKGDICRGSYRNRCCNSWTTSVSLVGLATGGSSSLLAVVCCRYWKIGCPNLPPTLNPICCFFRWRLSSLTRTLARSRSLIGIARNPPPPPPPSAVLVNGSTPVSRSIGPLSAGSIMAPTDDRAEADIMEICGLVLKGWAKLANSKRVMSWIEVGKPDIPYCFTSVASRDSAQPECCCAASVCL
ncbi:hypothetical protein OOU_Y34scaffold00732g4 [Pyricularia oryzae Y34]|uniref:Uncharacterized protein n=1 Tax=Pyricularia oryzae (strain Y34) TaxID=1143189 RepID=A0AA97NRL0_PYRO3|nr:hypothetical protein OOU_Y34scaffold00732g4 [Pyricularia oryzae Y34]